MAPRYVKQVLEDMLSDLSKEEYYKFWGRIIDCPEGVRKIMVEGLDYLDMAEFLIKFFSEPLALEMAADTLNTINCNKEASVLRLMEVKWRRQEYMLPVRKQCKTMK